MGISGTQKALMYALGGLARGGATRGGYTSMLPFISIGGTPYPGGADGGRVLIADLTIRDILDETPNTCQLTVMGTNPQPGSELIITLGSVNADSRLFGGKILSTVQGYLAGKPSNDYHHLNVIDYTWLLGEHLVLIQYTNQHAGNIARDLIGRYAEGITTNHIAPDVDAAWIDTISFTNVALQDALTQLCSRVGAYWNIDYYKDLHLFTTETDALHPDPTPLTPTHPTLMQLTTQQDLSQVATRVFVEGGGGTVLVDLQPGETMVPMDTVGWYPPSGQVAAGTQRLSYTSLAQADGVGSLIGGPGAAPSTGPGVTPKNGAGVDSGTHQWAYTWVTPSGETIPGPVTSAATQLVVAPATAPVPDAPWLTGLLPPPITLTAGPVQSGTGGVEAGTFDYVVTYFNGNGTGETTPGPVSNAVTTTPVTSKIPLSNIPGGAGSGTAPPGWVSSGVYRRKNGAGPYQRLMIATSAVGTDQTPSQFLGTQTPPTTNTTGTGHMDPGTYDYVYTFVTSAGETTPSPISASVVVDLLHNIVPVNVILTGPSGVTGRNIYRRLNGTGTFKLLGTFSDNTTTSFNDTSPNASLGADAPTANTTNANQFTLSNLTAGPATVTARKIYRSAAGQTALKLLVTIANNTATTYVDVLPDASLGVAAPVTDTSQLQLPSGTVLAGSTTLLLSGLSPAFSPTGGWAILGNGEVFVRYTGITANSLTGIPATGVGSISSTITFGSLATAAPALLGIPASGPGSIQYALHQGDDINLVMTCDDVQAQQHLAALIGGSGLIEAYIQDRRIGYTEALARGKAELAARSQLLVEVNYVCRDVRTRSGATIVCNLPAPTSLTGSYKIQDVTISNFSATPGHPPTYTVMASSQRYSLDDLLRIARGTVGA